MVKKTIFVVLAVIGVGVAALAAIAATRPDDFKFQRSIVVNAPAERIYPLITNFKQWRAWSPYENLDPNLKRDYSGADEGVGAVYAWDGNNDAGQGRMEIVEVKEPSNVRIKLDFIKPFEASNLAIFNLEPVGDNQTKVTWGMEGKQNSILCKMVTVFFDCESMCAKDFDSGLASIKNISEKKQVATQQENG